MKLPLSNKLTKAKTNFLFAAAMTKRSSTPFFVSLHTGAKHRDLEKLIRKSLKMKFANKLTSKIISEHPIELAYCLSLINSFIPQKRYIQSHHPGC
jgi:hypothetical protein